MSDAMYDFWNFVLEGTRRVAPDIILFVFFCSGLVLGVFLLFMITGSAFYAARLMIGEIVQFFRWVGSFFEQKSEEDQKLFEEALDRAMEQSTLAAAMEPDAIAKLKKKDEEALFQIGIEGPQKMKRSRSKRRAPLSKK